MSAAAAQLSTAVLVGMGTVRSCRFLPTRFDQTPAAIALDVLERQPGREILPLHIPTLNDRTPGSQA
jgi:hypothetical protein